MRIIDLLNKIANCEEVPKKIRYSSYVFKYTGDKRISRMYVMENQETYLFRDMVTTLTSKVEILETEDKIDKTTELIKENVYIDYYGVATFRSQKCVDELLKILGDKE